MTSDSPTVFEFRQLWQELWRSRRLLIAAPLVSSVIMVAWTLTMPNVYRGEILLAPVSLDEGGGIQLGGIEGLASLAGFTVPSGGNIDENLAVLRSREFIWQFVQDMSLMPVLFADEWDTENKRWLNDDADDQPGIWDAYRLFSRHLLLVSKDKQTGLVRVSIEWHDPELASQWANEMVNRLNHHLRSRAIERSEKNLSYLNEELLGTQVADMRQALYQLIEKEQRTAMIVNTQKEYAFRVIDPSVVPDKKVKPKRALLVILVAALSGFLALLFVLTRNRI